MNSFSDPVWADSNYFDGVYIMWQPKEEVGILMVEGKDGGAPKLIVCSLFENPTKVFLHGEDRRDEGFTVDEFREVLDRLESLWNRRQVSSSSSGGGGVPTGRR